MPAPIVRYALVGAVATSFHYAVLVGAVESALLPAPAAAALGAWLGAQVAFAGNVRYTFAGMPAGVGSWLRFQVAALIGAGLSFLLVGAGQRVGLHYLLAQAIATLVAMVATYQLNRRWSFAPPRPSRE